MKMRPGEPPRVTGVDSPARHKVSLAPSAGELAKLARLLLIMALVQQLHPTSPVLCSLSVADVFGSRPSDQPNATTSESSTAPSRRNSTPTDIVDTQREQLLRLLQAEYSNKNATRHEATLPASEPASASSMVHAEPLGRQSNYTDSSGPPSQVLSMQFPLYMRIIATFACLIIFTIGVCGNLLVPLVVIKTKYLRNSTNLFLINLSIADLLVLIVCMPTVLIELHSRPETWLLGEAMCKLSNFVEMLAANGSIFTILAISFERYYAICKPLKAGYKCTRLRATIIICVIWLLACILTSPILIMAKSSQTIYIDGSLVYNCILETDTYWPKMYVFVSMFAFFCLPLVVLILVYCLISRRLIRQNIATMDTYSNDHCDRHGSISQTGSGFERQAQPDSKRISMKRRRSLKPIASFFALVGNNHVHFNQKDPCEADSEPLKDQRHPMLVEKINSVLISQLNVSKTASAMAPPVGRALPINKTKSLDCHKTVHMRDDVFVPDTEGDKCAKPAGRPTWSHSNEDTRANHNYPEDIIVNKTFSPKECSRQSSGFISQLLKFRIFNFAQRAHKHSMANGSSNRTDLVDGEPSVTRSTCVTESNGCNGDAAGCKNDPPGRPKLISAFSCPSGAETERMFTEDRCDNYDAHQVPFVSSEKGSILAPYTIYRQAKCDDQVVEKMNNKRRLESKKKQANGTKGIRARSRFKWVKDSSISSATGSTYTNSTLLTSESSSKTPSLSKYSHYSATRQPIGIGAKSKSRASPTLGDGNKCAHLNVCDKTIGPGMKLAQTDATLLSTNSNSFSVSCDADNSSENSSSPGCLSTAPDVSKSSWLVSLAFQEHQYHHQIAQRQLNREHEAVIAQSNSGTGDRLPEETMDADKALLSGEDYLLELDYEEDSRQATQTSTDCTRDDVGFHTSINSGSYADKCATREGDNKFGRNGANERRKVKQKIVRSLTEDRQPCGRAKLKPTQSALVPLYEKLNCDKKMANPANKYTSKMSLVTVAHNLSDNLHLKHTSRRSGSQPSVSNQLMVNGTGELLAVRDASKKQQMDSRRQVVVMLAFVVACFFLLFFPYRVFTIWLILSTEDQVQSLGMEAYYNLTYFSRILIYLHSAINPIAYNLISTKFRRAFMSILLCRGSAARRNFTSEAYRNINEAKTNREKNKTNGSTKPLKSPKCDKDDLHG